MNFIVLLVKRICYLFVKVLEQLSGTELAVAVKLHDRSSLKADFLGRTCGIETYIRACQSTLHIKKCLEIDGKAHVFKW